MKTKTKLIATIMSICLVCAVFAIGVFALKTANLKIGGDVSFSATGVEAHIKSASLTGQTTAKTIAANDAEGEYINTTMTQSDIDTTFATWQNLTLDFNENGDDIVFKFDIANTSANADNYIEIDYDYSFTEETSNVIIVPGDENAEGDWENNNYLLFPKGSAETATYSSFTLKFRVVNKEINVPEGTKVNLTISLKHTTPAQLEVVNSANVYGYLKYLLDKTTTPYSASIIGNVVDDMAAEPCILLFPAVVTDGTDDYVVTKIAERGLLMANYCNDTIKLCNTIKTIESQAFCNILSRKQIILSKSLEYLGEDLCVSSVVGLTHLTIPASVKSIGKLAFSSCSDVVSVKFENPMGWYVADSADATEGTAVELTENASLTNAKLLIKSTSYGGYSDKYWFRADV